MERRENGRTKYVTATGGKQVSGGRRRAIIDANGSMRSLCCCCLRVRVSHVIYKHPGAKNVFTAIRNLTGGSAKVIPELSQFSSDQEKFILDQINTRSQGDLSNTKGIGNARGKAIVDHRMKHGPLTSLSELASLKGFGKGFFKNLQASSCVLPVIQKNNQLLNLLSMEQKKNISSLVSVDIGLRNAAFVHVDRDKRVLDWRRMGIPVPRPYSPVHCKNAVEAVVKSLPNADLYIIELQSHRASRVDPMMFPFVLHLRIVEAMFHCLLNEKLVFDMNPFVTARHFGLPTGSRKKKAAVDLITLMTKRSQNARLMEQSPDEYFEKVTKLEGSKETVSTIFAAAAMLGEHDFDKKWYADVSDELLEYFLSQTKKDDLSDCLLQALAFLDLAF